MNEIQLLFVLSIVRSNTSLQFPGTVYRVYVLLTSQTIHHLHAMQTVSAKKGDGIVQV